MTLPFTVSLKQDTKLQSLHPIFQRGAEVASRIKDPEQFSSGHDVIALAIIENEQSFLGHLLQPIPKIIEK